MHILIVQDSLLPVASYGGTERVVWSLGKALVKMGHRVTFLAKAGSTCPFAEVKFFTPLSIHAPNLDAQIPESVDIVHLNNWHDAPLSKLCIVTQHGNTDFGEILHPNTVFVSKNHAQRHGANSFVYNGIDPDDYGKPDLTQKRTHFHFLAKAAWRVKNVKGAIAVTRQSGQKLVVMGGSRLNISMGFRLTLDRHVQFRGMVGNAEKAAVLSASRGLTFPVLWHEPFGMALIESLYFGCPVFGTPYGSLPELITPEVGFLTKNSAEMAEILRGSNFNINTCHDYAASNFSSQKMAENYLKLYEKVLSDKVLNENPPSLIAPEPKFLDWD